MSDEQIETFCHFGLIVSVSLPSPSELDSEAEMGCKGVLMMGLIHEQTAHPTTWPHR